MKIITGKQFETLIERTSQLDDLPNVDAILEDVKRDFRLWSPFVAEGGVIAIHDSSACVRYCLSPYHFFIKKIKMAGWDGPMQVALKSC